LQVLVADNQEPLVHIVQRRLQEEGYRVDVARTMTEVQRHVRATDYALIVACPSLDRARVLLKLLRQGARRAQILAVIPGGDLRERRRCLAQGAADSLEKPFSLEELVVRCRALIRRAHFVPEPVLRIYDLEIDTNSRTVLRSDRPIWLTRREYALLQFLAFHRGLVMTRTMIYEHLYGDKRLIRTNVIDVLIRRLRCKIDQGFDPPLILTRWGGGYLLRGD
jgi:DNA-binding response OmpR family regulator